MKTESRPSTDGESTNGTVKGLTRCVHCGAYAYHDDHFCACCGTNLTAWEPRERHPVIFFCTQCGTQLDEEPGQVHDHT